MNEGGDPTLHPDRVREQLEEDGVVGLSKDVDVGQRGLADFGFGLGVWQQQQQQRSALSAG